MTALLIVGYGNPDREDDGVGWRVIERLAARLGGAPIAETPFDLGAPGPGAPDLLVALQLAPELSETLARYDRVCFVDAHTGAYPNDVNVAALDARFQSSPFTHHLTPDMLLMLTQAAYGRRPDGLVISVRGYRFGFAQSLSEQTSALADQAVERILAWAAC